MRRRPLNKNLEERRRAPSIAGGSVWECLQEWTTGNRNDTIKSQMVTLPFRVPSAQGRGGSDSKEVVVLPLSGCLGFDDEHHPSYKILRRDA